MLTETQLKEIYQRVNQRVAQWQITNQKTIDAFTRYDIEQEELSKG